LKAPNQPNGTAPHRHFQTITRCGVSSKCLSIVSLNGGKGIRQRDTVNGEKGGLNGADGQRMGLTDGKKRGLLLGSKYQKFAQLWTLREAELFVQAGMQNGNQEVREVGSAFVHLQPTDNAMIREILRNTGFRDTEVFSKFRLDGFASAPRCAPAGHIGNGHAQRLAGFDVIIRGQVGVGENPHARASRSAIRVIEFCGSACEQPAKIHFELRKARSQAGIAVAAAKARRGNFGGFLGQ
jgi:hypothetical protein